MFVHVSWNHWQRNVYLTSTKSMSSCSVITVPADGRAPFGARTSPNKPMTKFRSRIYTKSALKGLNFTIRLKSWLSFTVPEAVQDSKRGASSTWSKESTQIVDSREKLLRSSGSESKRDTSSAGSKESTQIVDSREKLLRSSGSESKRDTSSAGSKESTQIVDSREEVLPSSGSHSTRDTSSAGSKESTQIVVSRDELLRRSSGSTSKREFLSFQSEESSQSIGSDNNVESHESSPSTSIWEIWIF